MRDRAYLPQLTFPALFWTFALLYFLPVFLGTSLVLQISLKPLAWSFFGLSLFFSSLLFFIGYCLLKRYLSQEGRGGLAADFAGGVKVEKQLLELKEKLALAGEKELEFSDEVAFRNEQLQLLTQERDLERSKKERVQEELEHLEQEKQESMDAFKAREIELDNKADELLVTLEQKEQEIEKLQIKVHDLSYEIKTLLQVTDFNSSKEAKQPRESVHLAAKSMQLEFPDLIEQPAAVEAPNQIKTEREAHRQLRRCIDIAQKMTGSQYLGNYHARFRDFSPDAYALDLRRLCESLRSEKSAAVYVYSQKERRLLFINNQVKTLLGWTAEQFIQDFLHILQTNPQEWNTSLQQLASLNELQTHLAFKNKKGEQVVAHCRLGMIPTGIFRGNVIGVLYPA